MKNIIVLGAGGNSLAILDAIESINALSHSGPIYHVMGLLDDYPENQSKSVLGYPVVGTIDDASHFEDCQFVNGISSVESFRLIPTVISRTRVPDSRFATIIHPRAVVASSARVGAGSVILAGSVICPLSEVGRHVIVLQNSTLNHHSTLGDFVTLSAGITILGYVHVGENAFIGGGATIAPKLTIGARSLVGAGSTVLRDVVAGSVVAGNPARVLEKSRYATKAS